MATRKAIPIAVQRAQEVAQRDAEILGDDHPQTLIARRNVARALRDAGDYRGALKVLEQLLPVQRRALGPSALAVFATTDLLGEIQRNLGALQIARKTQEDLLQAVESALGPDDPTAIWVLRNLSRTQQMLRELETAAATLQEAISRSQRVHGEAHPETLKTMSWLAHVKRLQKDYAAAQAIDGAVVLRAESPDITPRFRIDAKRHLLLDLAGLADWPAVLQLSQDLTEEAKRTLPPGDEVRRYFESRRNIPSSPRAWRRRMKWIERMDASPRVGPRFRQKMAAANEELGPEAV
jgi:tetratricopeptide (TPR) repeat protein